jgi:hypothetical protein
MIKLFLGVALFAVIAAPAMAQVKADADPSRFDVADASKDGRVDRPEYDNFVEELVLLQDTDRDGKLSRDEVANGPDPSKFDKIDADKDGFLVIEELRAYSDTDFAAMDANSDGAIDRAESEQRK